MSYSSQIYREKKIQPLFKTTKNAVMKKDDKKMYLLLLIYFLKYQVSAMW